MIRKLSIILISLALLCTKSNAQELDVKVSINHAQVGNTTKTDIFDELQQKITAFMNEKQWTSLHFREQERISASLAITVNTYSDTDNSFNCNLLLTVGRPVYGTSYTTTVYSVKDPDFNFTFTQTDQLEYQGADRLDNNLVAMLAYYAYIIIGYDMDSFSLLGGTPYLQTAEDICTQAENIGYPGWKTFGDPKNRFGLLHDYLDGSMEAYRKMNYRYHREGMDQMLVNVADARAVIAECIQMLDEVHTQKTMSHLPQLFSEYKRDEIINIFKGKGTADEKKLVTDILNVIDPSQSSKWDDINKN